MHWLTEEVEAIADNDQLSVRFPSTVPKSDEVQLMTLEIEFDGKSHHLIHNESADEILLTRSIQVTLQETIWRNS